MDVIVVWLSQQAAPQGGPAAESRRALEEWARARGLRLAMPSQDAAPGLVVDHSVADHVEAELERARDAIAALDADGASVALKHAEDLLQENPQLPQSAWLMAEVLRLRATRYERLEPRDRERATRAWQQAAALDGGRMPGLGEEARASEAAPVEGTIAVEGGDSPVVRLDGANVAPGKIRAAPGNHHVVVVRDGAPIWARWVAWPAADGTLTIPAPAPPPCSATELRRARVEDGVVRAREVRCARWVAVTTTDRPDVIQAALCDGPVCGPLLEWRARSGFESPPVVPRVREGGFPRWGWALVGAGAMALTGVVLVSAGAFEQPAPPDVRFVNGGVRVESR
jgi:hypothetical protein